MTQYLLSVWMTEGVEPYATDEEMQQAFADVDKFNQEIQASGHWVFAGGLHPANTATVVRADKGAGGEVSSVVTTDGPFAETKEQIGGFWVIEAKDLDEALAIAARGSAACKGAVEVRPFQGE
ncbi:MAG TPA: YciI family protein [Acidimicrobiia bacterium]|jgi:hypothetical protein